jgi:hypothetical protein
LGLLLLASPDGAVAQDRDGSAIAALAGGALGLYSGAMLGFTGGIIPCTQGSVGVGCIRWHAAGAGAIGLVSGALLGAGDAERLGDAALSAGIGFVAGSAAGLVIKPLAQRFGWHDVLTVGLLGGAVGAAPIGSALGFGLGAGAGLILWRAIPGGTFPNAIAVAVAGLALGGLTQWVIEGARAHEGPRPTFLMPLQVRF